MEEIISAFGTLAENIFLYGFVFVFSFAIVILIHEFGHYLAARFVGVRIEKFSIGFGKEVFGFDDRHGTRWCLSMVPLGGFVKIFGDVDLDNPVVWDYENECERRLSDDELSVAFCTKKVWERMLIVLAGPAINAVLALALLFCLYFFYGQGSSPPVINALGVGSASYSDGFQLDDEILEMDGKPVRRFKDIFDRTMDHPDVSFTYKVLRDGKTLTIVSAPRRVEYTDIKGVERSHGRTGMGHFGFLLFEDVLSVDGVSTVDQPDKVREMLRDRFGKIVHVGIEFREGKEDVFMFRFSEAYNAHLLDPEHDDYGLMYAIDPDFSFYLRLGVLESLLTAVESIKKIASRSYALMKVVLEGNGKTDEPLIGGVAKMSQFAGDSAKDGIHHYIHFLAMISMSIAFINILPVPMLDGGFFAFLLYEAITGRQISTRIQNYAFAIGLVLLGGIMVIANLSDLISLLKW